MRSALNPVCYVKVEPTGNATIFRDERISLAPAETLVQQMPPMERFCPVPPRRFESENERNQWIEAHPHCPEPPPWVPVRQASSKSMARSRPVPPRFSAPSGDISLSLSTGERWMEELNKQESSVEERAVRTGARKPLNWVAAGAVAGILYALAMDSGIRVRDTKKSRAKQRGYLLGQTLGPIVSGAIAGGVIGISLWSAYTIVRAPSA